MKLNSLTPKSNPIPTKKEKKNYIPDIPFSLQVEISKKYEGISDNILGVINSLNPVIKSFFSNCSLQSVKVNHNYSEFILDNNFYLLVKDVRFNNRNFQRIILKSNHKVVLNKLINAQQ